MVRPDPDDAGDENWYGIEDRRQRKRIQDRLAQRARRRRLAESKKQALSTTSPPTTSNRSGTEDGFLLIESDKADSANNLDLIPRHNAPLEVPRSPSFWQVLVPTSNPERMVWGQLPVTVWAALFENGAMMGLPCSTSVPSRSLPAGPQIPEPLHPTQLQLTTIHPCWIDRFPFPRMRENTIMLMGIIHEDDFLRDLFCMASFEIELGGAPWDPTAWKIGREFSLKWGYLFC